MKTSFKLLSVAAAMFLTSTGLQAESTYGYSAAGAPGSTATDGWRNWINDATSEERDLHARLMSHIPMGRPAETREIAHAALFLADPDSAFVTAQILAVDGGWIAGFARDF